MARRRRPATSVSGWAARSSLVAGSTVPSSARAKARVGARSRFSSRKTVPVSGVDPSLDLVVVGPPQRDQLDERARRRPCRPGPAGPSGRRRTSIVLERRGRGPSTRPARSVMLLRGARRRRPPGAGSPAAARPRRAPAGAIGRQPAQRQLVARGELARARSAGSQTTRQPLVVALGQPHRARVRSRGRRPAASSSR